MRSLCKTFRDMPHYNVIFSALVKKTTDADNMVKSAIDITGSFALQLPALFDEVFYLGVTAEVDEATGRNKRVVLTQKTDKIEFPKDRSGRLARYEEADLGAIVKKMRATAALVADISTEAKAAAKKPKKAAAPAAATSTPSALDASVTDAAKAAAATVANSFAEPADAVSDVPTQ
jgi:hypothetical protein